MSRTIHHEVGAEAADDLAHSLDARLGVADFFNIDCGFGAESSRQLEPRHLRRADADNAPGAHRQLGTDANARMAIPMGFARRPLTPH